MIPDIGLAEILILLVVALVVIPPAKLPQAASDAGRIVSYIQKLLTNAKTAVYSEHKNFTVLSEHPDDESSQHKSK